MNILNLFKKKSAPVDHIQDPFEAAVNTVDLISDNPAADDKDDLITITYGTGMPIDVIYNFLEHDYEEDGYQDALVNPGVEYCKSKENIILNHLTHLFKRVLLRYQADIRGTEVRIENSRALFATTSAAMLESHLETCHEHMREIEKMQEELKAKAPSMMSVIDSYRRGFARGCTARNANFISPHKAKEA